MLTNFFFGSNLLSVDFLIVLEITRRRHIQRHVTGGSSRHFQVDIGLGISKTRTTKSNHVGRGKREIVPGLSSVEKKGPSNIDCHTLLGGTFFTNKDTQEPPPSHFVCHLFYFEMSQNIILFLKNKSH